MKPILSSSPWMRVLLLTSWVTAPALAQNPGALQDFEHSRQRQEVAEKKLKEGLTGETAPETYPGERGDIGDQYLLKLKPKRQWVQATFDSQYFYTSNMFLQENTTKNAAVDTGVWVNTAEVAIAPTPFDVDGGKLAPRVGYRHQWFLYGLDKTSNQLNNFDFDVQSVFTDVHYQFANYWVAGLSFEWNRFLGHENTVSNNYDEFYREYLPSWSIERYFVVNETLYFSVGYTGNYHITDIGPVTFGDRHGNDRMDHTMSFLATWQAIPEHLFFQPYYRFMYSDYTVTGHRDDFLHTVGLNIVYAFNNWASVRTFISWDHKESDINTVADYSKLDAGLGASLVFRF